LIEAAALGDDASCADFVRLYSEFVRACLRGRWSRNPHLRQSVDDAAHEVFFECLKPGGVLARADPGRPSGFRGYLRGVVVRVARRHERATRASRVPQFHIELDHLGSPDTSVSRLLDRDWAVLLVRKAARDMEIRAKRLGAPARRRVELLRLRFHDGLPIRAIAERWNREATFVQRQYNKARNEFEAALTRIVARRQPRTPEHVPDLCARLMDLLL
jgi:RNA polymerase sigma-70 factor (ECF subfamily)